MRLYFILDPRGTVAVMAVNEDDAWNAWISLMPEKSFSAQIGLTVGIIGHRGP